MFIKLSEHLEKTLPLKRVYKGIVVDNNDPKKLGRVKVTITGLLEGATASLPWCSPQMSSFLGGSNNSMAHAVPEVGSELEIRFPFESVYSPFYYGYWHSAKTHVGEFDTDYPNTYGFKDSAGNKLTVNKTSGEMNFEHQSGVKVKIDNAGTIEFDIPKDLKATIAEKLIAAITGDAEIMSDAKMKLAGKSETEVGDASSPTKVQGVTVTLANGGFPVSRIGDTVIGIGNLGMPVVSTIVTGSPKVNTE